MSTSLITLADLRLQARYKADMVNSNFITDTELNVYANASAYDLYDLLVTAYGEDYYNASSYSFTTDGNTQSWSLPNDFFKLAGVDCNLSGQTNLQTPISLKPFKFNERNKFSFQNLQTYRGSNLRYRLKNNQIYFNLIPQGGQLIKLWYVPQMTQMVLDTDTIDGVDGWQEYVVLDMAIKMKQKQDDPVDVLAAQRAEIKQRIIDTATNRDQGESQCVSDTTDYGSNGNSGGFGELY